ncbi:MAG: DUF6519 domain-containing protein [Roseobacter sp.]
MKTQTSQFPASIHAPFSGVYLQQGRMFTDADGNALSQIAKDRVNAGLQDAIGTGSPEQGGIVAGNAAEGFEIVWGDFYVNGIRAVLEARRGAALGTPFDFADQADFPLAPALPEGAHRLYLDVWERSLTALEDEALLDPALHGADTTTRTRTMAQMKWAPLGFDPEDTDQNPCIGEGRVTLSLRSGLAASDACEPCLDEIDVSGRVGNYAYRIEIHAVERTATGAPERLILKWSRENGAETARIGDEPPGFRATDWVYEFYHGAPEQSATESHHGFHHPAVIAAGWSPSLGQLVEGYPDSAPAGVSLVRRWDGYLALERDGAAWRAVTMMEDGDTVIRGIDRGQRFSPVLGSEQHGHINGGSSVALSLDTMQLVIELADHQHLAGDYWTAVVREALHSDGDTLLDAEPPVGIKHHYMCLANVAGDTLTLLDKGACKRFQFPPLTNLHAEDVCYDNAACDMPGVGNVQEALDHLCKQKDLEWHNKHLHGWGIVCGLIVECCDEENADDVTGPRDCVNVTKGYAIDCDGRDIILDGRTHVDLLDDIRAYEQENPNAPILRDGNGTACLSIELTAGAPHIRVEPHQPNTNTMLQQLMEGTLLGDFIQHCVRDLLDALQQELSFMEDGQAENAEGDALVSPDRRKLIAFGNLIAQTFWRANGPYIWMSRREYDILRALYGRLTDLLGSKTFCAMFTDDNFPPYPFEDIQIDTWFGADQHTKVKADPTGQRVYTYGGTDANIHVYDVARRELVEIIRMNAAEGAEVTAIALTPDGRQLYAAASIKGADTVLGIAKVGETHEFERPMQILCDILISDMEVDAQDTGLIYAIGLSKGLFFLRPDVLAAEEKPKPEPMYAFNATGQMAIDPVSNRAFALAGPAPDDGVAAEITDQYSFLALCPLDAGNGGRAPLTAIRDLNQNSRRGTDDIAVIGGRTSQEGTSVYIAVDPLGKSDDKEIITYNVPPNSPAGISPRASLAVEDTQIALAADRDAGVLYAAFEDSFRLQVINADGVEVQQMRVPVQMQPTDLAVGPQGDVYVNNYLSSTVTAIPRGEVQLSAGRLSALASVRFRILLAFYTMVGNLFQYLKDCLCHHLLVKCPECDGTEKIYLACVEIRDDEVYNICNFGKRKYVQTFMAWNYWLSVIPVIPLIKQAIARTCCAVLPNFLDRFVDDVVQPPPAPEFGARTGTQTPIKAKTARGVWTAYRRTDFKALQRQQGGRLGVYMDLVKDATVVSRAQPYTVNTGLRKEAFRDASTDETLRALEKAGARDVELRAYDPKLAPRYMRAFAGTSGTLDTNAKLIVYEKDGKTAFISEAPQAQITAVKISREDEAKLAEVEARVAALRNTDAVRAELSSLSAEKEAIAAEIGEIETRMTDVSDTSEARAGIAALAAQKASLTADLSAIEARVVDVGDISATRAELAALASQKGAITADLSAIEARTAALRDTATTEAQLDALTQQKNAITAEVAQARTSVDVLRRARAEEEQRIADLQAARSALKSELDEMASGLDQVAEMRKRLKVEVDTVRPIRELQGLSARDAARLERAGVRTIGELAGASSTVLRNAEVGTDTTARRALITMAKKRLQ